MRDLWSPYGDADMLERAHLLAYTNRFRKDEDIELALDVATAGGAAVIGEEYGLRPGDRADLVLVPAESAAHAVVSRPERTLVIKDGIVVTG